MTKPVFLLGVGLLVFFARPVAAQPMYGPQNRINRPPVSPYLDLLRPGGPTRNYYRRIRPELEFRGRIGQIGQSLRRLTRTTEALRERTTDRANLGRLGTLRETGHPTSFLNLSGYFGAERFSQR